MSSLRSATADTASSATSKAWTSSAANGAIPSTRQGYRWMSQARTGRSLDLKAEAGTCQAGTGREGPRRDYGGSRHRPGPSGRWPARCVTGVTA